MCQTERTSALSTPMPKALVATMTSASPAMKRLLGRGCGARLPCRRGRRARGRPRFAQRRGDLVGVLAGAAVDDRRPVGGVAEARPRAAPCRRAFEPVPSSGTTSKERLGRSKPERTCSGSRIPKRAAISRRDRLRRRRRAGHHRRPPEPVGDLRQPQVVGPEVVPPLGDAVRLVDRDQVDPPLRRSRRGRRSSRSAPASSRRSAPRRRAPSSSGARSRLLAHPRGDHRHRVPGRGQPPPLVPHQRDQRADDDRQVLRRQPGQLVAEALAAAGRHHDQRVAPLQRRLDRLPLPRPPVLEPELRQQLVGSFPVARSCARQPRR